MRLVRFGYGWQGVPGQLVSEQQKGQQFRVANGVGDLCNRVDGFSGADGHSATDIGYMQPGDQSDHPVCELLAQPAE